MPAARKQSKSDPYAIIDDSARRRAELVQTGMELVPLAEVREALLTGRVPAIVDPDKIQRVILERLMAAGDVEALFSASEAVSAKEVLGEPFMLTGAWFLPSDYSDDGQSVYVVLELVDPNGARVAVTTGGAAVVRQALVAIERGWLPYPVKLMEVGREKQGRDRPLYLVSAKAEAQAVAQAAE